MEQFIISGFADEISPDLDTQIKVIKDLNMKFIECRGVNGKNLIDYSVKEAEAIKKQLDEAGIKLSSLGSPIGKIQITDDFEAHFKQFQHAVEIAAVMDTKNIRMFSFFVPEGTADSHESQVFRQMERMVDYAASHHVVLLHENEKEIYGDVAIRCKRLMERFYSDHFKAVFDFANFVQCGQDTLEAYDMLAPYVDYIHIKDARKEDGFVVPAGMGDGNVEVILKKLKEKGFHGFLSLEPHLADFVGFAALENGNAEEKNVIPGETAFVTAYNALQKILKNI
jgi:sugar phosphate isomerase/epimerase